MTVTATQLRKDIYRILDQVLETGTPVEIDRKGHRLKIVLDEPRGGNKLEHLVRRDEFLKCDPEELVHLDWSSEWKP